MQIVPVPLEAVWIMRHTVMYPEETIDFVKLAKDDTGTHLGLYEGGVLISVVSLFEEEDTMQFRKFATRTDRQGKGYGTALLQYVMDYAANSGKKRIWCNARQAASGFYTRFGMQVTGEPWQQYGLDFVKMEKLF